MLSSQYKETANFTENYTGRYGNRIYINIMESEYKKRVCVDEKQ